MGRHLCFLLLLWGTILHLGLASFPPEHLQNVHKKFEFKYSFKPPMLVNSHGNVPFWERGGDAIPTEHQIRVCPSIQDRRGWLWTKNQFEKPNWMIDVEFSISGKHTYGADGMAFWYTANKGYGGSAFGNTENFVGLAVIIDTFDNNGMGDSPKIGVYLSDGSLRINQGIDGQGQDKGNCIKFIRNKRYNPKMRIVYYQNKLEVWVHEGDSNDEFAYEMCAQVEGVTSMPSSGFFGVSATTGGLSDDHDVKKFVVHSLKSLDEHREEMIIKYDEEKMKSAESDYQKKSETFESKRSQYDKDHQKEEKEWQKRVEMEESVQLIYDMHQSLNKKLKDIYMQLDVIMSKGSVTNGGTSNDGTVLAAEGRMTHHLQELRSLFEKGGNNNVPVSEQMQPFYAMKENVNKVLTKMDELQNKIQSPSDNSCSSSCLSTWFFIMAMLIQSVTVVVFLYYKHSQERNAKKFF